MSVSAFPYGVMVPAGNTITLHGTSGSPILSTDTDGTSAVALWTWYGDNASQSGISYEGRMADKQGDTTDNYDVGNGWTSEQDTVTNDYWIRFTAQSGDTSEMQFTGVSGYDVWHAITNSGDTGTTCTLTLIAAGKGSFTYDATVKVEIAGGSGGTPLLATGYYRWQAILT